MEKGEKGVSLLSRLRAGLTRTRETFVRKLDGLFSRGGRMDEDFYEELEAILIQADVGVHTAFELVEQLRETARHDREISPAELRDFVKNNLMERISRLSFSLNEIAERPHVIMVVGVNGTGKTTTIGKLAARFKDKGHRVILAAADTFRAAAAEQLNIWAQRSGVDMVKHQQGADPAAVAFDGLQAAIARKADVLLVDTAGRLHNKENLMRELEKIKRVLSREIPGAPHEVLLVVDATTGQNALNQAKTFGSSLGVTGIVLTKLDGTAKGGIVLRIIDELDIPVKLVGMGEGIHDLREFDPGRFLDALFDD